jgi:hypothetical protein
MHFISAEVAEAVALLAEIEPVSCLVDRAYTERSCATGGVKCASRCAGEVILRFKAKNAIYIVGRSDPKASESFAK